MERKYDARKKKKKKEIPPFARNANRALKRYCMYNQLAFGERGGAPSQVEPAWRFFFFLFFFLRARSRPAEGWSNYFPRSHSLKYNISVAGRHIIRVMKATGESLAIAFRSDRNCNVTSRESGTQHALQLQIYGTHLHIMNCNINIVVECCV